MILGECPCEECKNWYRAELQEGLDWKTTVNRELPCPCKVSIKPGHTGIDPIDDPSGRNATWTADSACTAGGQPSCATYHPGAYGCLRSTDSPNIGSAGNWFIEQSSVCEYHNVPNLRNSALKRDIA